MTTYTLSDHESVTVLESTAAVLEVDAVYLPGGAPPPLHWHPSQTETFEVVEGELHVTTDGEDRTVRAGESFEISPGVAHRMWNAAGEPARARWRTEPAMATEHWFATVSAKHAAGRTALLDMAPAVRGHRDVFRPAGPRPVMSAAVAVLAFVGGLRPRAANRPTAQ